jgi:pimeloyl-ACP methyl ester carboxylesterase
MALSTHLICMLVLVGLLFLFSTGKTDAFLDKDGNVVAGSISEKTFVTINGVEQGMFIQSKDTTKPVLLYLHGGIPDYYLTKKYPTALEDIFTVVWWDQRWAGISYNANNKNEPVTLPQLISDTKEVTNYLRKRFGKEKIYLMGRSGGSFIGMHVVAQAPELYHAYIGVGQMSNHFQSEKLAYEYMLKKYREMGNLKMVRKLEGSPISNHIPTSYLKLRDEAMHGIGIGTTRNMRSIVTGVFLPSLTCRAYTLSEKINFWRAKAQAGVHPLWDTIIATDLSVEIPEIEIPVYFFHGIHDYTVSYVLAKEYFGRLKAPIKAFYTFNESAHSPMFEEPEKMLSILREDVLKGRVIHTDKLSDRTNLILLK